MKDAENKQSAFSERRARIVGGAFVMGLLALVALGGLFFFKASDAPADSRFTEDKSSEKTERADPEDAGATYRVWKGRDPAKVKPNSGQAADNDRSDTRWVVVRPDIIEESASQEDAVDGESTIDVSDWVDPENQRVLGPKSWISEVSEAETEAIEQVLDEPIPVRYPIDLRVREWSVDITAEVVEACFGDAEPYGRFVVNYVLAADGMRASFEDVHMTHLYELEDPIFVDCVVESLSQRSFRSSEDGRMEVSQPFLFDGIQTPR